MQFDLFYTAPEVSWFSHAERYADWQSQRAALMMLIHVAPTCEVMRQGVERYYRNILSMLSCLPASYAVHQERLHNMRKILETFPFQRFCQQQGVFGDPQECIDRLQAVREEFDLCQLICWFDQGCTLSIDDIEQAMAGFADEVMPKV